MFRGESFSILLFWNQRNVCLKGHPISSLEMAITSARNVSLRNVFCTLEPRWPWNQKRHQLWGTACRFLQISADFLTRYIRSPATRSASCAQISDVDLAETTVIIPFAIIIIVVIIWWSTKCWTNCSNLDLAVLDVGIWEFAPEVGWCATVGGCMVHDWHLESMDPCSKGSPSRAKAYWLRHHPTGTWQEPCRDPRLLP